MKADTLRENETDRLSALYRYRILDTEAEAEYDDFTMLAAQICGTPMAWLSLVDAGRLWFKSKIGCAVSQTPRDNSFCGHAIRGSEVFEVRNAVGDERFSDYPLVTRDPNIRFYAGTPLLTPDGHAIGTLCVIDGVPRQLDDSQKIALATLGRQVMRHMELRLGFDREHQLNLKIARQSQLQQVLHHSEARLDLALKAARTSLWDANPQTGRIVLDAHWAELIGAEPKETETSFQQLAALLPPEEVNGVMAKMLLVVKGERTDYIAEHRVRHRNGHWLWIESRGQVVERDADGRAVRMLGTNADITERRVMEQMKAEFVSTVSHELRTPLTSISGSLGLICGGVLGPVTDQIKALLDIAYKNCQRLTHLINDLLDMEKLAAGKLNFDMEVQELMPLVRQSLENTRDYAQQYQVTLVIKERTDGVRVRVDASRLQQVMSNFLSNAVKFSPQGGQVEVAVRQLEGWARVEVIDHGSGVPEEFRGLIFQKFSQADSSDTRQTGGTGLGLAITKELVERMHGRVGFDSQPGHGACFHFELPIAVAGA